jgi:hypothetical protein
MLCRHHHRHVHEGQVLVSGNTDELVRFRMDRHWVVGVVADHLYSRK